jgi:tetratricopeptide (TPR) repeat protein
VIAPDVARDAFACGLRALSHERLDVAVEQLGIAVNNAPSDPSVQAFYASALFAAARPDEAADAIARALDLAPIAYWPNMKAGELRMRLGDPAAAVDHFLVALRATEPGDPDATAAQLALVRARREMAGSISHRAVLPRVRWPAVLRRRAAASGGIREP